MNDLQRLLVSQIWEKLLDIRYLRYWNLIVKLLVVWTFVLIVLRDGLRVILITLLFSSLHPLLLLLKLVELKLAARATRRQVRKIVVLLHGRRRRDGASTLVLYRRVVTLSYVGTA